MLEKSNQIKINYLFEMIWLFKMTIILYLIFNTIDKYEFDKKFIFSYFFFLSKI